MSGRPEISNDKSETVLKYLVFMFNPRMKKIVSDKNHTAFSLVVRSKHNSKLTSKGKQKQNLNNLLSYFINFIK